MNDALANAHAAGQPWPDGSAAVQVLYDRATDYNPSGYVVYVKAATGSPEDGSDWYWYARVADDAKIAHDAKGIAADGFGNDVAVHAACVDCHSQVDQDAAHTLILGARPPVYLASP